MIEESQEVILLRAHYECELRKKQKQLDNLAESTERLRKAKDAKIDNLEIFIKHTAEIEEGKKYTRILFWVLSLALVWYVS